MRKFSFFVALLILLSAMPAYTATASDIVSISLSDNSSVLSPGQSRKLNAYAIMSDGTFSKLDGDELSWESSDTQLITVSSSGTATAIGDGGFSVITARLGEKSGSICLHSSSKYLINHGFESDKYTVSFRVLIYLLFFHHICNNIFVEFSRLTKVCIYSCEFIVIFFGQNNTRFCFPAFAV